MFWQKTNKSITIQTPAKLNLFLEILGKRPDGFHELETVMTAVELFDQITIELDNTLKPESPTGNSIDLMCRWNHDGQTTPESTSGPESAIPIFGDLPTGPSNLIYRAADRFLNYVKIQQPLKIRVEKKIPSAAGLGGASANAAGTLIALDQLLGTHLGIEQLAKIGEGIGSDVPFFIYLTEKGFSSGMAFCRGKGEKISALHFPDSVDFVVVRPPIGLSTASIFSKVKPEFSVRQFQISKLANDQYDWNSMLFNRLQETAEGVSSEIRIVCDSLIQAGCHGVQMTGSGSCCFGICENRAHALAAASQLTAQDLGFVFTCRNLQQFSVRL